MEDLTRPVHDRRSDAISISIVAAHISLTYAPVYAAAVLGPTWFVLVLWLSFGWLQNGLINLMHECAHQLTFRRRSTNDWLGKWVLGPLVLTDFEEYRTRHWEHHRYLGSKRDPKLVYRTPIRGWAFIGLTIRCATGLEALRRLTEKPEEASDATGKQGGLSVKLVLSQAVFLGSILIVAWSTHGTPSATAIAAALAFVFVYGYGLGSVTIFAAAVRAIAEHQICDVNDPHRGSAALRNLRCNPLSRLLLGAYGFGEHATHHHRPSVPYYALPGLTRSLQAVDVRFEPSVGYLGAIVRCARHGS